MLIRKLRVSIWAFFVLAVLLSSRCVWAKRVPFELDGKTGSAVAIITKTELDLIVDVGKEENYPDKKIFTLTIGGCAVDIEAGIFAGEVTYGLKVKGVNRGTVTNLKAIIATSQKIHFTNNAANREDIDGCSVNFGERKSDGSYHVNIKLSGDDVPGALKLSSKEAKMEEKEPDLSGLKIGLIVGGSIGAVIIVLLGLSIIGFICYRCRKAKSLREEQEQLLAAKNRETAKVPEPVVKPVEAKVPEPAAKPVEEKKASTDTKSETKPSSKSIHKPKEISTVVKPKETPKAKAKSIATTEASIDRKSVVSGQLRSGVSTETAGATTENHKTVTNEYQPPMRMHTPSKDSKIIQLDCDVSAEAAK